MRPAAPTVELSVYDDASNAAEGARLAREISAGDALLVLGPGTTAMALNEGPIYSDAGVVGIGPTTTGDRVTDPENFFRAIFSTSDAGEILASYIRYNLGGRRAIVLMKDDAYGHAVADGFNALPTGKTLRRREGGVRPIPRGARQSDQVHSQLGEDLRRARAWPRDHGWLETHRRDRRRKDRQGASDLRVG